ncbi:tumor necrosis factor alpha-induced protein 8 [Octopus bimaculoides]|nr:tumor necrosis factor alpha-induced protein 8 [Octopus bimaculoides]XP_014783520.1 tumor necrosis factor alpha-induced protein 8 [Octopus bimaculoides]|eukprot:XP_014783513.1 PREDICTED: tumor necrosis factor alpha-induced protein 8-like [Octopus bimaculoides]
MATDAGAGFDSRGLGLRVQKKLLGKMSNKKIAKIFVDETLAQVLDNMCRILKDYSSNKKEVEKILKYIIKTIVKIGILFRNDQFNQAELTKIEVFKQKFNNLAMTIISFCEVDFTYDRIFLQKNLEECRSLIQEIVNRHLTDKSKTRIDTVFRYFSDTDLLDELFSSSSKYKDQLNLIVADMHKMIDEGNL